MAIVAGGLLEVMKGLPGESIDLIVTDPPYKVTARGNYGNTGGMLQKKLNNSLRQLLNITGTRMKF